MTKHDRELLLSMGNSGKNSNSSQFFVTFGPAPQCDGKHVIFGEVVSGKDVIFEMERFGSPGGEPTVPIQITECGAYHHLFTPGAGSWFDRPDSDSFSGKTPEFIVQVRVGVLAPTKAAAERFRSALGEHASVMLVAEDDAEGIHVLAKSLENFSLDIVIAAPACAHLLEDFEVPSSWIHAAKALPKGIKSPSRDEIFLVSKPVEALSAVMSKSWMSKRDGWILSGSFI